MENYRNPQKAHLCFIQESTFSGLFFEKSFKRVIISESVLKVDQKTLSKSKLMVTNNHRLILGIGNSEPNSKMEFLYNKAKLVVNEGFDRKNGVFSACKDFLCPPENQFREWFPIF